MNANHIYQRTALGFVGFLAVVAMLVVATITAWASFANAATIPIISDITATNIGTSSATMLWTTHATSSSWVLYGTTTTYGNATEFDATSTTNHSVPITGLSEDTLYHFVVSSGNEMGTTTSADNFFTTASTSASTSTTATSTATTTLAVTGIDTISSVAIADGTFTSGWKWVLHFTVPDMEDAFRMKFGDFFTAGSSTTIPIANNLRSFSSQSSNAIDQNTAIMEIDNNYSTWMYFTGDTSTTTPGRQVDVTIEMRVPTGTGKGTYTTVFGAQSVPSAATSTTP